MREKLRDLGVKCAVILIGILMSLAISKPEEVKANTVFTNAYMYYSIAGNVMNFIPGDNLQGEIYYATKAKKAVNSGILYTTIGWQVVVHDSYGYPIEVIYYQMGGSNMVLINVVEVDGYEYCLYKISLPNIKARMSQGALAALNTANSFISFNACTTTKINGVVQGGVTDYGPAWGVVYTTYEGIANAQSWSAETLQTLYSYYNKPVYGMFYSVTITAGEGIARVSGAGSYCYGATATISATPATGYEFSHWEGATTTSKQTHSFVMTNANVSYKAVARPAAVQVNFYRGDETQNKPTATVKYQCGISGQTLPNYNWKKAGYHQVGWSTKRNASVSEYSMKQPVVDNWIRANYPSLNLYAVWEVNQYTIVFDANGGNGSIAQMQGDYFSKVNMPVEGFLRERATLVGWSTKSEARTSEFVCGEEVTISTLADLTQVQYETNQTIVLYAVWDFAPEILGDVVYVTLEDAKNGTITDQWLSNYVKAEDPEDGFIAYGVHEQNSFLAIDYALTDFTMYEKEGMVTQWFHAIDHVKNETVKQIKIYIVDTTVYDADALRGRFRFISNNYYRDKNGEYVNASAGGLWEDSLWKTDDAYRERLDQIIQNTKMK